MPHSGLSARLRLSRANADLPGFLSEEIRWEIIERDARLTEDRHASVDVANESERPKLDRRTPHFPAPASAGTVIGARSRRVTSVFTTT